MEAACFTDPWTQRALTGTLSTAATQAWLLTTESAVIAAYVCFQQAADEAELLRLAVDPGQQRCGRAAALLNHAWSRLAARGATVCHLEVRADNRRALEVYRVAGFVENGRRHHYYADRCDALMLTRTLVAQGG